MESNSVPKTIQVCQLWQEILMETDLGEMVTWPTKNESLLWSTRGSHKPQAKESELNSCFNQKRTKKKKKQVQTATMSYNSDKKHTFCETVWTTWS